MKRNNENGAQGSDPQVFDSSESQVQGVPANTKKIGLKNRLMARLAAVAFAEAGEFETADELLRPSKRQSILLVIEGETPDEGTFNYAMRLCQRIAGEIDILQIIDGTRNSNDYDVLSRRMSLGSAHMVTLMQRLERENVPFKITIRIGDLNQKLFNYAKRHKNVAVVVLDSPKAKAASKRGSGWSGLAESLSRELSIPLVTVFEKQAMSLS